MAGTAWVGRAVASCLTRSAVAGRALQSHWPTVAEFARRNGDFVCGIVLVDALQGPGAHVTGDPQSPLAPDIVRTVNMLEDGLAFSYCGRGRGAVPPVRWRWRACRGHTTPLHLATGTRLHTDVPWSCQHAHCV